MTPMLFGIEGAERLAICARDVQVTEAIALALPEIVAHADAVRAAYDGGPAIDVRVTVDTQTGPRVVELRAPATAHRLAEEACKDLTELDAELERAFAEDPEGSDSDRARTVMIVSAIAVSLLHRRFISLSVDEADELIFDVLPRVVLMEPSAASSILDALGAYTRFLIREHHFTAGPALRRRLGAGATARLEATILAPRTFGWPLLVDLEALATLDHRGAARGDADRD